EYSIKFPVAELKGPYNFSFSGLKTAVLRYIQKNFSDINFISTVDVNNIAASFQQAVIKALIQKTEKALKNFEVKSISLVGGVAANNPLREEMIKLSKKYNKKIIIPKIEFCGDNAAMIAFRGQKIYESGKKYGLHYSPYPSLPEMYFS
ncbi:MAG TPA: tRNA (adenosine(37)-N6)-threonylcarbamoyltransferase complex transferase subunit TsaD, partial [Ignavibacteria bacterium]|nr:tRNA (adenosine(37)-N6)-threonylcarbamoyltransferase complex transferase subunit TsaD [Ignavibacteria bacterium]